KLIDGSGRVITNAIVVVQKDRIRSVSNSDSIPTNAPIIDMSNYTAVPGLIDAHTHMTYSWNHVLGTNPLTELFKRLPQENVFLGQGNARRSLECGVTSVRDLMAENYSDIAMRNLINQGAMVGPRMFVAGPAIGIAY